MLKLNRVVDYGIVILCHLLKAEGQGRQLCSAKEIAEANQLSQPMVSKILKTLVREDLVVSVRGIRGGYTLAARVDELSIGDVVRALDGPIRLTDCSPGGSDEGCELNDFCSARGAIGRLNGIIEAAFDGVRLRDLIGPFSPRPRGLELPAHAGSGKHPAC